MALDLNIGRLRKLNQRELVLVVLAGIIGILGLFYLFRGEGGIGISQLESRFTAEEARAVVGSQLRVNGSLDAIAVHAGEGTRLQHIFHPISRGI